MRAGRRAPDGASWPALCLRAPGPLLLTAGGPAAWVPGAGNHEVEAGNGPLGYLSYQSRYRLPSNHSSSFSGNWYSFQVGSVLFISLDNNDVVYANDGGAFLGTSDALYIRGYSNGLQEQWLERTLHRANQDPSVDWIVAYMHQPAMSSSSSGSGSDLGIRQSWFPLFYKYGRLPAGSPATVRVPAAVSATRRPSARALPLPARPRCQSRPG